MENKKVFKEVNNYTKYKLVMMLIEKYKDKKIDNINLIEKMAEDILKVLAVAGMKYYNELRGEFDENRD
jgi:dihydroneopterin aldolase